MQPDQTTVMTLLDQYLDTSEAIGFAIGTFSPANSPAANLLYAGRLDNYHGDPLTLGGDTFFELASISKTMCATLFAYYCAQNPALRDAMVSAYHPPASPALDPKFDGMPLLSLANYTSGLWPDAHKTDPPSPWTTPKPMPHPYTVAEMYEYLHDISWSIAAAGKTYTYSNLGFALLGESLVIATNSASSYGDLLEANLLRPLLMNSTVMFNQVPRQLLPRGYAPDGTAAGPGSPTFPAYYGAGGAVSTPNDMMKWLEFNTGATINPTLTPLLPALQLKSTNVTTKQGGNLGLGWFLKTVPTIDGPLLNTVWKDGGYAGYHSFITFLASDQPGTIPSGAGVFVLTNSPVNVDEIGRVILCLMCGYLPAPPPPPE